MPQVVSLESSPESPAATTRVQRPNRTLARLALAPSQRGLLLGGTGTGKSTLAKQLMIQWRMPKEKRILIIFDSKPRWGASWMVSGLTAKHIFRGMQHLDFFPGSVLVRTPDEFVAAWRQYRYTHPIIVQESESMDTHALIARWVFEHSKRERAPILVYADEMMDHFRGNGYPVSQWGTVWARFSRNGRELGIAFLAASQRTKAIPVSIVEELSKVYLFEIDRPEDLDRLRDCGFDARNLPRLPEHSFWYYTRAGKRVFGPYRLAPSA